MNAAERKEIERCRDLAETIWQSDGGEDVLSEIADLKDALARLLSAPPRNCDVGTAEDWRSRFNIFCERSCIENHCDHRLFKDEEECNCFARWMAMPYKEGGKNGD